MTNPLPRTDQILRDIDRFNDDKLKQWFIDAHERYTMIDVPERIAFVHTLTVLLMAAARGLDHMDVSPEEAGEQIALAVKGLQKKRQKTGSG